MAEITIKLTEKMVFDRQHCNEDSDCSECSCCMANGECLFNFTEERKQGKWKRKLIDSGYNSVWLCSECKEMIHLEFHDFKFCPYCGADMRGSEE